MKFFSKQNKFLLGLAFLIILTSGIITGCAKDPMLAYFADGTSAGSDIYTINVDYDEDSRFDGKYVDILIKSNIDELTFLFKREFDEDTNLFLQEKDRWYSITNLLTDEKGEKEEFEEFKGKVDDTLVIKSEQDAIVHLKVVLGDLKENSEEKEILINHIDVSKVFELDLGKNLE